MHQKTILLFLLLLLSHSLSARQTRHPYKLIGSINVDSGRVTLYIMNDKLSTDIVHGKFSFSDSIPYPTSATLAVHSSTTDYSSGQFFIDPDIQTISCDVTIPHSIPKMANKTMRENNSFIKLTDPIRQEIMRFADFKDSVIRSFNKNPPIELEKKFKRITDSLDHAYDFNILHFAYSHHNS